MTSSPGMSARREFARHATVFSYLVLFVAGASTLVPRSVLADPLFGAKTDFVTGAYPLSVAIADLNGDGRPDLAVTNGQQSFGQTVSVLLGNGDGTFGAKTDFAAGSNPWFVAIGDLNGDGRYDLAVANYNPFGTVSVSLGNGDGTFGGKTDYATATGSSSVAIGDLNGDGKPDLAVTSTSSSVVSVLLGVGSGTFGAKTDFGTGGASHSVAIGDLNGDVKPDLAVANLVSNTVSVLPGVGDGTFREKTDFGTGASAFSVAIGNLNRDGIPDLAVANLVSNTVSVMLGNGDGTFRAKTDYGTGGRPSSVAIGDLNGDGKRDLATANDSSNSVSVLLGNGDGTFGAEAEFVTGGSPRSVAIGDLNGDGKPDLVVANYNSSTVSVLLNTLPELPTPTLVQLFRAVPTAEGVRVDWQLSEPSAFQSIELQRGNSEMGPWSLVQEAPQEQGRVTSVLDDAVAAGQTRWYRLNCVQRDGHSFTFGPISAVAQEAITAFTISPLSPNPSTGRSLVAFAIPARTWVRLTLTDVQGREVVVLTDGIREAGHYTALLDASDLCAGMYFVRMQAQGLHLTQRLAVVR